MNPVNPVHQAEGHRGAASPLHPFYFPSQSKNGQSEKLTIAEADIIFYGDNALAGAKEFASLVVGQGYACMTPGMGEAAATVLVRRGTWALYDQESYRGRMTVVSSKVSSNISDGASLEGVHLLDVPVRSYKRIR